MATGKDTGPLDWRIAIVDKSGRPTPEFQRRWATQRTNNGLIGFIGVGTGAPTGVPAGDGELYADISTTPVTLYIAETDAWVVVGVINFTDLLDVPHAYTSASKKLVRVKSTVDGLEFTSLSAVLDDIGSTSGDLLLRGSSVWGAITLSGLIDTLGSTQGDILFRGASGWEVLAPGTAGFVLSTNGAGADPTWIAGGSGPTAHRYWRMLVTTNGPGGLAVLAECGFCTVVGGATVTTGGTALADSAFGGFVAANAFDGNPATDWATASGGVGVGYIGYDFGMGNDKVILDTYITASTSFTSQCPLAYAIQASDDGVAWSTVGTGSTAGWTSGQTQRFPV